MQLLFTKKLPAAAPLASLTYGFDEAAAAIKAAGFTSVEVLTGHGFETQEL